MKKILIGLVAVLVSGGAVLVFGDSMFTGVGDSFSGVGTYKVMTDGTSATVTADYLSATKGVYVTNATGNIPKATITNALGSAGSNIGGNIPVAAITNAAGTVGASIGGNIPVASITNAAGTVGASIGGNIPVAAITNALAGTAYTTNTLTGDGVTNVFIWRTVGTGKILHSITTTP